MTAQPQSIGLRARAFPCRTCGAKPGEFCRTSAGHKSYTAHLSRLEQENDAWLAKHRRVPCGLGWPGVR